MRHYVSWSGLKNILVGRALYFKETEDLYDVFVIISGVELYTELWKNEDAITGIDYEQNQECLLEFENTFKSTAIDLS